jgi:hypothetical protein
MSQGAMAVLVIAMAGSLAGQVGAPPRIAAPEVARKMRQDAEVERRTGLTAQELEEFKKLREADAELLRKIVANAKKYAELEQYVNSLDISVDTKLLTEARDNIKELQRAQKAYEEERKQDRDADRAMIQSIKSGTIMLVIGALLSTIVAILKWLFLDPKRRRSDYLRIERDHRERAEEVIGAVQEAKEEAVGAYRNSAESIQKLESSVKTIAQRIDQDAKKAGSGWLDEPGS